MGFHATTLQHIAEDEGVNRTSVHYYFRSREKLYGEIIKKIPRMSASHTYGLSLSNYAQTNLILLMLCFRMDFYKSLRKPMYQCHWKHDQGTKDNAIVFMSKFNQNMEYVFTKAFEADNASYELTALEERMMANNHTLQNQYLNLKMSELDVQEV